MANSNSSQETVLRVERESLKKSLTVMDLFAIGYGDLGSSIYYALGITAVFALGATPIALMLAGLVFVCTALTYAEMSSCFHESGGSASFARHAFNDLVSFIAGWGLLLDYIVTIAISAFSIGPYLAYFIPELREPSFQMGFTVAIISILLLMNVLGVRESTRFSLVLTVFTIITQTIIVAIAAGWLLDIKEIISHMRINVAGASWSPTWPEFWKGTAMAMVAYTGIESIAQLGAEVKKPSRTVPKAVLITMYVLVAMYIGLSVVALSALTPQQLGSDYQNDPIAGIVSQLPFGTSVLGPWLGMLAAALLFVAANAGLIGASRLSYNLGEYYQLPRLFSKLHPRFKTPHNALFVFAILASIIVLSSNGELSFLADLYNFGAMLAFTSAHMSLIAIRIKQPSLARPFKIPLNIKFGKFSLPISAIVGGISTMSVWVLVVITKPEGRYLGLSWMLFGIAFYMYYRRKKKIKATASIKIEQYSMPKGYPLALKKIMVPVISGIRSLESVAAAADLAKAYNSTLMVVFIHDIPPTLPIDADFKNKETAIELFLKKAEGIAHEANVEIETKLIRSRKAVDDILEQEKKEKVDLILLSADTQKSYATIQKVLQKAVCRVWVCSKQGVMK